MTLSILLPVASLLFLSHCGESTTQGTEYKGRKRESRTLDPLGKPIVVTAYHYDDDGRLIREFTRDSSEAGVNESEVLREYDGDKLVRIIAYDPPGTLDYTWNFQYDPSGQLLKEAGSLANDTIFETITYQRDDQGSIIAELQQQWGNLTKNTFEYDGYGRLVTSRQFGPLGDAVMTNTYTYGNDTLADTVRFIAKGLPDRTIVYTYDSLGKRIEEKQLREDGSSQLVRKRGYDHEGNILFDEDFMSGNRVDYLYENGHLKEERHKVRGGRLVGVVYYE